MSERDIVDKYRSDPISSKYGTDFILAFSESSEAVVTLEANSILEPGVAPSWGVAYRHLRVTEWSTPRLGVPVGDV